MVEAVKQTAAKADDKNGKGPAEFTDFDKLGGTEIFTDRPVYKPEHCKAAPLVGYVLDEQNLPNKGGKKGNDGKDFWTVYVILLTKPTLVCDREGKVMTAKIGQEIMIPKNVKLAFMSKWARNPDVITEVVIQPKELEDIGGGQSMWTFRQKVLSEKERPAAYRLASPNAVAPEVLSDNEDIPFGG